MNTQFKNRLMVSVLGLGAWLTIISTTQALAVPIIPSPNVVEMPSEDIVAVQFYGQPFLNQPGAWQQQLHGNRCRNRTDSCQHFHQGFYYQNPWWVLPQVIGNLAANSNQAGGSHVQWCLSHYRSYNPRTDMWMGNNGRRYRCNSGY